MKNKFKLIVGILVTVFATTSQASSFMDSVSDYAAKYIPACVVGLAGGYMLNHDYGLNIGAVACAVTFTYGEFGRGSNRTMTSDDVALVNKMLKNSDDIMMKDINQKMDDITNQMDLNQDKDRKFIRSTVTDMGAFLEKDLSEKLDKKMENPKIVQDIDNKVDLKVKEEMANEFKSQEKNIIDKVTDKVVKKVTAEEIIIEPAKPAPAK